MTWKDPRKILLLRLSSMGDVILTSPAIRALKERYPKAALHMVVKAPYHELVAANPHLDRVIALDPASGWKGLVRTALALRRERYDVVVDIHNSLRSRLIRWMAGSPRRLAYRKNRLLRALLVHFHLNLYRGVRHVVDAYFSALAPLEVRRGDQPLELFVSPDSERRAKELLREKRVPDGMALIGVCPVSRWATKRWKAERFAWGAQQLGRSFSAGVIVFGGRGEEEHCRRIAAQIRGPVWVLAGEASLQETAAVIRRLRLLVTNDTGLMHMAAAVGTRLVALFGPTTREFGYFPYQVEHRVMERELPCRPCTKNGRDRCPLGTHACMELISREEVLAASRELLEQDQSIVRRTV